MLGFIMRDLRIQPFSIIMMLGSKAYDPSIIDIENVTGRAIV